MSTSFALLWIMADFTFTLTPTPGALVAAW